MTIKDKILNRINNYESNKVFISNDFIDIASSETVRKTLNRLVKDDVIKRIIKGFYYRPAYSELIDEYEAVSIHELALAIARKYNWNIAPYSNTALNILGLSTQVPSKWIYNSSGRYKKYSIGKNSLEFKKVKPSEIANMSQMTAIVIQAIRAIGQDRITKNDIAKIKEKISDKEIKTLMIESKFAPAWIYEIIRKIGDLEDE